MAKKADFFVAQTDLVERELKEQGINEGKIVRITNSVDEEKFSPVSDREKRDLKKKLFSNPDCFVACFCGRLVKRKGLKYLLEAWKKIGQEKVVLIIIGSGDNQPDSVEEELKNKTVDENIKNVFFIDSKKREELIDYLRASDVFVYPSIHPEGTALSVLESMSCGVPVIVSRIGGLKDVIDDGKEGLLVTAKRSDLLSQALLKIIDNREFREKLGKEARTKILKFYSTNIIVQKYLFFFSKIIFK